MTIIQRVLSYLHIGTALLCTLKIYLYLAYVPVDICCDVDLTWALYCYFVLYGSLVVTTAVATLLVLRGNEKPSRGTYWYFASVALYAVLMIVLEATMYAKINTWLTYISSDDFIASLGEPVAFAIQDALQTALAVVQDIIASGGDLSNLGELVPALAGIMGAFSDMLVRFVPPWETALGLFVTTVVVNTASLIGGIAYARGDSIQSSPSAFPLVEVSHS